MRVRSRLEHEIGKYGLFWEGFYLVGVWCTFYDAQVRYTVKYSISDFCTVFLHAKTRFFYIFHVWCACCAPHPVRHLFTTPILLGAAVRSEKLLFSYTKVDYEGRKVSTHPWRAVTQSFVIISLGNRKLES